MADAAEADPIVARLAHLYLEHPAWVEAASYLSSRASSTVYFAHRPGEAWRLVQEEGRTRLRPGAARDPDLVFRFTPAAIDRLEAVDGGVGDFAVELFSLMIERDPELRVGFRIVAGFARLAIRGYTRLLLAAGPKVLAFGATHGVASIGGLRRLVSRLGSRGPADWEV